MKEYQEHTDSELMYLISESNEEAKNILFEKYKYIISIMYNKYKKVAGKLGLEVSDLYQEALLGYTDAINRYKEEREAKLATFITLCVERRMKVMLIKANRQKQRILNESYSLEYGYGEEAVLLKDIISDNEENNPLNYMLNDENLIELEAKIKEVLSDNEYQVYALMANGFGYIEIASLLDKKIKSVDNTMQRIKNKIKKILESR